MEQSLTPAQARAFARMQEMMRAYLVERDAPKTLAYFTEEAQCIGTGFREVAFHKTQLQKMIEEEIAQDPTPFELIFEEITASEHHKENLVFLYMVVKVKKHLATGIPVVVQMRQSALLCKIDGEYYIKMVHVSVPATLQKEDEYSPIRRGDQTLQERKAKLDNKVLNLLNETLPGGLMGGYIEPGFPLYFINDRMLESLGYSYDSFMQETKGKVINCIYPSDRAYVEATVAQALETGDSYMVTYRMLKKDGSFIWVYDKGRKVLAEDGREAIISVCIDITAQVEAQNELSFIAQSSIGGLFKASMDDGFTVLYANECYYRIHGYTRQEMEELFQNQAARLVHPEDIREVSQKLERAIKEKQEAVSLEYRVLRGDGKIAWIHASAGLTQTNEGMILSGMVINIDERKSFEQKLQWSEKRFQIAIEQTKINVWEYDLQTRSILQTEKSFQTFGMGMTIPNVPESLIDCKFVHPDDAKKYAAMYEKLHQGEKTVSATVRVRATDGRYYWEKIDYTNVFSDNGTPVRAVAVSEDITAQKEAEQRFFQEEHLREMLSADVLISAKINLTKNKVIRIWSGEYPQSELESLHSYDQLFEAIKNYIANQGDKKRYTEVFSPIAISQAMEDGTYSLYGEYRCINPSGRIIWCAFHLAIMCDPDTSEQFAFGYIRDINERKKTELALRERAERDALTGLYNRQTAESMIDQRIAHKKNSAAQCAFFIVDMDDFKQINDRHGHHQGDQVLREVGRILRVYSDGKSIAGRLGGDEFILFFEEIPSKHWAQKTAEKLCEKLNISFCINGEIMHTSASVGIVTAGVKGTSFQKLFQQADAALYDAKFQGKAQYTCFNGKRGRLDEVQRLNDGCIARQYLGERCMLDELDDSVFIIDKENYDVLFMSSVAQREFGIEEYSGRKCYEILQGFTQPCIFCQNHLPQEHGFKTWENTNARLHKRFMVRDKIIRWDGKKARLEIFTDLTKHEAQLNSKVQAEHVLLECASLLMTTGSLDTAIHDVLENLGRFYRADRAYFVRTQDDKTIHIAPQDWCAPGIRAVINENGRIEKSALSSWLENLKGKRVVVFHELEQMHRLFPEKYAILREKQVSSFAAVALLDDSRLIGYIGIENPRGNLDNTTMLQSLSYFLHNEISKRRMQEQQAFVEEHDDMTGLLNWRSYSAMLTQIQPEALSSLGVLVADINHLRVLNEEYGHRYGDKLLMTFAERIKIEFDAHPAFRLDGDSFVVLCQDLTYEKFLSQVDRLRAKMDEDYPGCISFGSAWEDEDIQPTRVLNNAKEFLMITKEEQEHACLDNRLRAIRLNNLQMAIKERRFKVYLQPKAELSSGKIKGAEALIRYCDEEHGVVPPIKFIPRLEMENNIRYIDFFVLEEVCAVLKSWQQRGLPIFPVSMNFSRCTLMEQDVVEKIKNITDQYDIDRGLLEIEITESMGEMDRRSLKEVSRQIIEAGYRLSLDDFGSEYSNISILSSLLLNGLKLDKSVIHDLYSNPTTRLLVENLIHICREIGIDCIAEGVEEQEQLEILKSFGCTYAQGYLFNKPLPIQDFERKYLEQSIQTM